MKVKITKEMFRLPPYRPASKWWAWSQVTIFGVATTSQVVQMAHALFFGRDSWWWWVFTAITATIDFVMLRWALEGLLWWRTTVDQQQHE